MGFKTPDGKVFETRAEWRDYMMATFYSFKGKKDEPQPLIKEPGSIDGQMFDIADCDGCTLVIMDVTEQIQIDDTKNCRIFIGFAPFNGGYPDHAKHLSQAKLDPQHNLWYDIYDHNDPSKTRVNWHLIDPAKYEEPWYPAGVCDPAVPRTAAGSVSRQDEDSSMQSFGLQQMRSDAAELAAHAAAPPVDLSDVPPPPLPSADSATVSSEPTGARIAIIGRGEVGITLGRRLVQGGWSVQFGSRNPDETRSKSKPDAILDSSPIVTIAEAAAWSQFILLTVPGMRSESDYTNLANQLGSGAEGKVVLDATNPLSFPELEIFWDGHKSAGELFQAALPKSFVFKAFNTVGLNHLGNPDGSLVPGRDNSLGPLKMLYCGPMEQKEVAAQIIYAVGFHPVYVGAIRYSRNLEAIAELWIHLAIPGVGSSENWGMGFHFEPTGV